MADETDAARLLQGVRRHFDFCHNMSADDWLIHKTRVACPACTAASYAAIERQQRLAGLLETAPRERTWRELEEGVFETTLTGVVDHGC